MCVLVGRGLHFSDAGTGGGAGGPLAPPQYFADKLTLFEPGRADYPHLLLLALPMFFTFRHHCIYVKAVNLAVGFLS